MIPRAKIPAELMEQMAANRGRLRELPALCYLIGTQKAGTTWLRSTFHGHADTAVPRVESHYWNVVRSPFASATRSPEIGIPSAASGGRQKWLRVCDLDILPGEHSGYATWLMSQTKGPERVAVDATPGYMRVGRATFAEMAAFHPNPRFIFVMRDPVDRFWSGVHHRLRHVLAEGRADRATVEAYADAALGDDRNADRQFSDYARTIAELEAAVPPERILYLFYETLFTQEAADRIAAFLGIRRYEPPVETRVNEGVAKVGPLDAGRLARARAVFEPTYRLVAERFGDAAPGGWLWQAPAGASI